MSERLLTQVDGLPLALSNLDAALFADGFTKGELVNYYVQVAEVLLPHLQDRVLTRVRFPNGTANDPFYEKNLPAGAPDWVQTARVISCDGVVDYPLASRRADLVWLANLKAIELHAPQWRLSEATSSPEGLILEGPDEPRATTLMIDLDPGAGVDSAQVAEAAILTATALAELGMECSAKSSGNKGLQLSAAITPTCCSETFKFARALASWLTQRHPKMFVATNAKAARKGRVFVDYAQNLAARNTICAYSVRGLTSPWVSTPLTWDEVGAIWKGATLRNSPTEALERIQRHGDLWATQLPDPDHPKLPEPPA